MPGSGCKNELGITGKDGIVGVGEGDVLVDLPRVSSRGGEEESENGCDGGRRFGEADSRFCSIS